MSTLMPPAAQPAGSGSGCPKLQYGGEASCSLRGGRRRARGEHFGARQQAHGRSGGVRAKAVPDRHHGR